MGVSPSRFMGREPARVTYKRAWWGGMVAEVTVPEPEFTDDDRALIVASRREDEAPRGAHGILLSEATDPKNAHAFVAHGPTTDFAQVALDVAQERWKRENGDAEIQHADAMLWGVSKR